jgi:hypothetical protein
MRFVQIFLLPPLSVFSSRSISSMPRRSGSSCSGSGSTGLRFVQFRFFLLSMSLPLSIWISSHSHCYHLSR